MMKKLFVLLLVLTLLLCGCSGANQFKPTEDGTGYVDTKTDRTYVMLDIAFESGAIGAAVGEYSERGKDDALVFYEITGLDSALYLADEDRNVYYAGETLPDASAWRVNEILLCEGSDGDVARLTFKEENDGAAISRIRNLWFEGEEVPFLSLTAATKMYSVKLTSPDYPNLYYCFSFLYYEGGTSYFYNSISHRAVIVPDDLVELLCSAEVEVE